MIEKSIFKDGANKNLTHPTSEKGITLIALIITIIVMLVLVVVSINIVLNTGLFESAGKATKDWKEAQEREEDLSSGKITIGGQTYNSIEDYLSGVVEPENIDDWEYTVNDDGTVTIDKYKGSDTEVVFPNCINGMPVTTIGSGSSIWHDNIKEVIQVGSDNQSVQLTISKIIISEGIQEINRGAFSNSVFLSEVILPTTLRTIDNNAFSMTYASNAGGSNLTTINFPDGLEIIGEFAFYCSRLTSVTIPNSVVSIGMSAFEASKELKEVYIPNSVETIGQKAFNNLSLDAKITCEFPSKPDGWDRSWEGVSNIVWLGK